MLELEVGMYCYNKCNRDLGIGKILTEPSEHNNVGIKYKNGFAPVISVGNVVASHNIIDLIECGDYVNGELVSRIKKCPEWHGGDGIIIFNEHNETIYSNFRTSKYEDIKTIVTKQQMESMQYEVK